MHAPDAVDGAPSATTAEPSPPASAPEPDPPANPAADPTATAPAGPEPEPEPEPEPKPEPEPAPTPPRVQPKTPAPVSPAATAGGDDDELPERLSPMQTAGWWTLFGGVAVGTLAGVMAGLAERQEDRALRLSVRFELDTGAQSQYQDVRGEYESTLRKGRAQANAGIALAVIGLAATVAGIAVLAVAGKAQRKRSTTARWRLHGDGMTVRF